MILAAGFGSRLRPLTQNRPKALVRIAGAPLLEHILLRLKHYGFDEIILNAHHMADQIVDFLEQRGNFDLRIEVSLEEQLLGTGGGLQRAAWFFDDGQPFLLHNVDVLTDLDPRQMMAAHQALRAVATLAVRQRETARYFLFDREGLLVGWQRRQAGQSGGMERRLVRQTDTEPTPLSFMGIHVLSPRIFELLTEKAPFSIRDAYLRLAQAGEPIRAFRGDDARWLDVGRPENLAKAEEFLDSGRP